MLIPSEKTFLLDIETSGLHREKDQIISIGCTYQKNDTPTFRTFFFNDLQEEKEGLLSFLEGCNDFDTIVTFRGKGFDYPFLKNVHPLKESFPHLLPSESLFQQPAALCSFPDTDTHNHILFFAVCQSMPV